MIVPKAVGIGNGGVDGKGLVTLANVTRARAGWVCTGDGVVHVDSSVEVVGIVTSVRVTIGVFFLFTRIA